MKNININKEESLLIDEDIILKGSANVTITAKHDSNFKIILKDFKGNVTLNIEEYANVTLNQLDLSDNSNNFEANLKEEANLTLVRVSLANVNSNLCVNLNGYKAHFEADFLSVLKDKNITIHQNVYHNAVATYSNLRNESVVFDNANSYYETTGKINKGMAKSKCLQLTKGIIVGEAASIKSQPILLIDEYDVFANHGCAIGKMSDDELFYLMSRGISKEDALKLIIKGVIDPIVDILCEEVKEEVSNLIDLRM
jgi:Fe-S cluster assembly scaffold protein SufB